MKVPQYKYLSAEAVALRQRDGIPPWGVHPCEVESVASVAGDGLFWQHWREAKLLRDELERD